MSARRIPGRARLTLTVAAGSLAWVNVGAAAAGPDKAPVGGLMFAVAGGLLFYDARRIVLLRHWVAVLTAASRPPAADISDEPGNRT